MKISDYWGSALSFSSMLPHPFITCIASFLVRPFDPGKHDGLFIFYLNRLAKVGVLPVRQVITPPFNSEKTALNT